MTTSPDSELPLCHHRLPGMSEGGAGGMAKDVGILAETDERISFGAETVGEVAGGVASGVLSTITGPVESPRSLRPPCAVTRSRP